LYMLKFSFELKRVFDLARKIKFYCSMHEILSANLLLSMAMEKTCFAYEVLSRLGLDLQKAKSFVMDASESEELSISQEAGEILSFANNAAAQSGYKNICSHHLLLSIVTLSHKSVRQLLWDFGITADKISAAVNAMNYYKIGLNEYEDDGAGRNIKVSRRIKNKDLEREILNALNKNI
jgi:ATP-dependent Clp protease ATP-binding subunit ClpA